MIDRIYNESSKAIFPQGIAASAKFLFELNIFHL